MDPWIVPRDIDVTPVTCCERSSAQTARESGADAAGCSDLYGCSDLDWAPAAAWAALRFLLFGTTPTFSVALTVGGLWPEPVDSEERFGNDKQLCFMNVNFFGTD